MTEETRIPRPGYWQQGIILMAVYLCLAVLGLYIEFVEAVVPGWVVGLLLAVCMVAIILWGSAGGFPGGLGRRY